MGGDGSSASGMSCVQVLSLHIWLVRLQHHIWELKLALGEQLGWLVRGMVMEPAPGSSPAPSTPLFLAAVLGARLGWGVCMGGLFSVPMGVRALHTAGFVQRG